VSAHDPSKLEAFLAAHWAVPGAMIEAADAVFSADGADPGVLRAAAAGAAALAAGAEGAGLPGCRALAEALARLAERIAAGALPPLGPAGQTLGDGARAIERAFVRIEAGERPDEAEFERLAERARRAAGSPVVPAAGPAASRPAPAASPPVPPNAPPVSRSPQAPPPAEAVPPAEESSVPEAWGPWDPPYPDIESEFFEEVRGHIDTLQAGVVRLSGGDRDDELVNGLFRSSHSVKGLSGQMAAPPLGRVAHKLEDVLDLVRRRQLEITPATAEILLSVIDGLAEMLRQLQATRRILHPIGREIARLERVVRGESAAVAATPAASAAPPAAPSPAATATPPAPSPAATATPKAPSPAATATPPAAGPAAADAGTPAQSQYLRIDSSKVDQVMNLVGDLFTNKIRLHEGVHTIERLQLQLAKVQGLLAEIRESGERGGPADPDEVSRLTAGIGRLAAEMEGLSDRLASATGETDMISNELRDQVMGMRMVPLDTILHRLGRVVFDALQKENRGKAPGWKQARLVVEGSDAEVDKAIASALESPLVHVVRNAVGHGIEPAADRTAGGKAASGTVTIRAGQRGGHFVIEISDDGRGIDPAQVGRAAIRKGVVTAEALAQMSEKEIVGMIFRPGFTTVEAADDLKGRGVGLDEVVSKLAGVKGTLDVRSTVGRGATVVLSVPLTLAIHTVLLAKVADEALAIPMDAVERVVSLVESAVERMGRAEVFTLLGQTVPLLRADDALGLGRPPARRPDTFYVAVLDVAGRRFGLAMDEMTGKEDVVVKSLGTLLVDAPLVAGATLLGERCVMILDPAQIAGRLETPGAVDATAPAVAPARGPSRRPMLLVEDDLAARLALRRIFEEAGFDVHEAGDGVEALERAKARRFQFVSTDVVMPRMDGYELTRRLRQMPEYRGVPILMISSRAEEVDRRKGFDAGVDHYLAKPFERRRILALVEEVFP
jgi:chemotaxis protein histidine kinase CheA/CheY-like chemotaxis protein